MADDPVTPQFATRREFEEHARWIASLEHKVTELRLLVERMPTAESIIALRAEVSEVHRNYAKMEELVSRQAELARDSMETSRKLLDGWRAVGTLLGTLK